MNKILTLSAIVVAGVLVGSGVALFARSSPASGQSELHRLIPRVEVSQIAGYFTPEHDLRVVWLYNDIGRGVWTDQDRERVHEILSYRVQYDVPIGSMTPTEFESWDGLQTLLMILAERLAGGGEVDAGVALAWYDQVDDLLLHPQPFARAAGVAFAVNARMASRPEVLTTIERLAATDPDDEVRRVAVVKLGQHNGNAVGEPCPTCPGG